MNRGTVCGQPLPSWPPKARNHLTHHALTEEKTNQTPVDWKEVEEAEGHRRENPPSSLAARQSLRMTPGCLMALCLDFVFSSVWQLFLKLVLL